MLSAGTGRKTEIFDTDFKNGQMQRVARGVTIKPGKELKGETQILITSNPGFKYTSQ